MPHHYAKVLRCLVICLLVLLGAVYTRRVSDNRGTNWKLQQEMKGENFFPHWWFWDQQVDGTDPTHGYVYYTPRLPAWQFGLVNVTSDGSVYIGSDYWSVVPPYSTGRSSIRLTSYEAWDYGLFIADIQHMPTGCSTWPAWWLVGPNWPNGGEIDIIEGVNVNSFDQTTLHTSAGCDMSMIGNYSSYYYGSLSGTTCNAYEDYNSGCGIVCSSPYSYGANFNSIGGGVFALEWTNTSISAWFFARGAIPFDIFEKRPEPQLWGVPYAYFPLGDHCPPDHFSEMNMVIDLTFCGDWAGNVFADDCPQYSDSSCNSFVQENPAYFDEAYWIFNNIQIYQ